MAEIKTRPIGKALFGVNFEPTGQAPLDARLVVENMETLLANETYVDRGNNFYEGMPVIVKQGKSGKSELWVLIDGTKVTEEAGWRRLDADGAAINGNIEDAINGLDSTVGTTTVDTDKHVAVEVAQVDGKLTKITVTEKDIASATELTNTIKKIGTGFDETNTVAKAFEKEASNRNDAIKKAVDDKNVTAEGDNYITATAANNKVTVRAGVQGLTVTPSAGGSTITGTAHSLVDGAEVANKVAAFTNARISEEIAKLDVSTIGADGKFITKVSEVDGKIAAEFAQVKANEVKLEQVKDADNSSIKLNATTVQEGFAELFGKMLDNEEVTAEAVNKIKTIFGITGEELKYEAKSDNTIIGNATSYSDADAKLAESIKSIQDNTVYDCGEF